MKFIISLALSLTITALCAQCPRELAVNDYLNNYLANKFTQQEVNWSGTAYSCNPGTYNSNINQKMITQINYFRRMVDLNDDVTFDAYLNQICQESVVMQEVNGMISHCNGVNNYPCNTWPCSTSNAIYAAQRSLLASGHWTYHDPVSLYIQDPGPNNQAVGHRRWLLYPKAKKFGNGITGTKNVIYVSDNFTNPSGNNKPYVAYPPDGYIPAPLVYDRWSFSIPYADFSYAYVRMTDDKGYGVQLNVIHYNGAYGDPAIVWEPTGIQLYNSYDKTYTVTIGGIRNSAQSIYTYNTTIIQPNHPPVCPANTTWNYTNCQCQNERVTVVANDEESAIEEESNCVDNINIPNQTILTGLYSANKNVNSSGVVNRNANVWFYAEDRIRLDSNFKVKAGAKFKAKINPCGY